jgi:polygalacturonase
MNFFLYFFKLTLLSIFIFGNTNAQSPFFNVKNYGAMGNGDTLDTQSINAAIEAAFEAGGGTVYFPAGIYPSYSFNKIKEQYFIVY